MKYIAFYDTVVGRRPMNLAAVNKVDYICSAIRKNGFPVQIVSCGMEADSRIKSRIEKNADGTEVFYFKAVKIGKNKLIRYLQTIRRRIKLFFHLLRHTKSGETVLAYHSLAIMNALYWAKRFKGFRLILETEEIYNDVFVRSEKSVRDEKRLFSAADAYIFPSDLLDEKINILHKPSVVIHGSYATQESEHIKPEHKERIDVVYSGSFDPNKGGLLATLDSSLFLPQCYRLHILGRGNEKTMNYLNDFIDKHSGKDACEIVYAGLLHGKDYTDYLENCDIGLSTQNPDAKFNDTSFPSKILAYMACDLRVVSARIRVVETSGIGKFVSYYSEQSGKSIADAVLAVRPDEAYNGKQIIAGLDQKFCKEISLLL